MDKYKYFMAYLPKSTIECEIAEKNESYEIKSVNNMHDKLFRDLLGDKEELSVILNKYLGINVKSEELEKYNSSFITSTFRNLEADTVYKLKGKKVFFLIEHQSSVDNSMPFRILKYNTEIINDTNEPYLYKTQEYIYAKVIPIVIYTGGRKWKVCKRISSQLEKYGDKNYLEMKYNLVDINNYDKKNLLNGDTMIEKAMLIEKCKKQKELVETIDEILKFIDYNNEIQVEKITRIIKYALSKQLGRKYVDEFTIKIKERLKKEGMNMLWDRLEAERMQWKKQAEKEGMQKGMQKGIKEGRREGRKEGKIESIKAMVRKMLEFGEEDEKIQLYTGASKKEINQIKNSL